jgi:hypothetical protein
MGQSVEVPGNGITIEVLDTTNAPDSITLQITVVGGTPPPVPMMPPVMIALLASLSMFVGRSQIGRRDSKQASPAQKS